MNAQPQINPYVLQVEQLTASDTWTIIHNLNKYPAVDVYIDINDTFTQVIPNSITFVNSNVCTIHFSSAQAGLATIA